MTTRNAQQTAENAPEQHDIDRREFLTTTAAVGGAMVLGFWLPPGQAEAAGIPVAAQPWYRDPMVPEINAWITIVAPDDTVTGLRGFH